MELAALIHSAALSCIYLKSAILATNIPRGQIRPCCGLGLTEGLPGGHLGFVFALWFYNLCNFIFVIEGFFGLGLLWELIL